jgi:hypothetical protein
MFALVRLFWKIYFFFAAFLFFRLAFPLQTNRPVHWIDLAMMLPSLVGLYGFAFGRDILFKNLWRLYFLTLLTWDFYYHFVLGAFLSRTPPLGEVLFFMVLLLPLYTGLFLYAFVPSPSRSWMCGSGEGKCDVPC